MLRGWRELFWIKPGAIRRGQYRPVGREKEDLIDTWANEI
jgi:hypothetical protein